MSVVHKIVKETDQDNNDPELCSFCENVDRWPDCMKNTTFRGYHSLFKIDNYFDVISCDNHKPKQFDPRD
jgi:hypothetical protein